MKKSHVAIPRQTRARAFCGIYSVCPEMHKLFAITERVAASDRTALLTGETGTGKELFARAIHSLSARKTAPFLAINSASLSPTLLESELFGHVKGAFTGAIRDKKGAFGVADTGTLFLDEVADIPLDIQGHLLRVLQEKTFTPVGGTRSVKVDVRLVSATNRMLMAEVAAGRFRADLSYRLRVIPIYLPPLRSREGDVEALTWHFVRQLNAEGPRRIEGLTRRALEALRRYHWPGNVRELISVLEYAFVVGHEPVVDLDDLPPELKGEAPSARNEGVVLIAEDDERERLRATLNTHDWDRNATAAALGISRATLWRRMREHGLGRRGASSRIPLAPRAASRSSRTGRQG